MVDPKGTYYMQTTLQSFGHELLVNNLEGILVLQQHGGADGDVSVFHSRRLRQLISQDTQNLTTTYRELQGRGIGLTVS